MTHDDTESRRRRLRALRERHAQQEPEANPPAFEDDQPLSGETLNAPPRRPLGGPAEKRRRGGPFGGGGGRRRQAAGRRGGGLPEGDRPGRGGSVQRLLKFLTQPSPGGRFIPGTEIKEDRIKQVMQFLRNRADRAEGPGARRIQRVVAFLTREEEGATIAAGVNVANLTRLVSILQKRQAAPAADVVAEEPENDELDTVFDELVEDEPGATAEIDEPQGVPEAPLTSPTQPDAAVNDTLQQLVGLTRQLSEQLQATQRQVEEIKRERQDPAQAQPAAAPEDNAKAPRKGPGSDWFDEYLD